MAARERIEGGVLRTPCMPYESLGEKLGATVYVKMDNLQRTGSFKERGARNALLQLSPEQKIVGVVAASAGNHALGLAMHGKDVGVPVTVVMPTAAPLVKRAACEQLGATVVTWGDCFFDAYEKARELAEERGYAYIHGYDDPAIIAGQGTMGLEILEQVEKKEGRYPDSIIVPVGGGGLIAGIAAAVKHLSPETTIYGVEPKRAAKYAPAVAAGHSVRIETKKTIADGLATPDIGQNAFETMRPLVERVVEVDESAISLAVLRLMENEKSVVEGAGAAGVAGLLTTCEPTLEPCGMPDLAGQLIAVPLCGGNIDPAMIGRVIERGLAADGRLTRFETTISDRPGGLAALAKVIADAGASVKDIVHDRAFATSDLSSVDVRCIVETSGKEGASALRKALESAGFEVPKIHGRPDREAP
jgi:threonine dehydratase